MTTLCATFFLSTNLRQSSRCLFLCLLISASIIPVCGQVTQAAGIEIPLNPFDDASQYKVLSLREQGLLLTRPVSENPNDLLLLTALDTAFKMRWETQLSIPKFSQILRSQLRNGSIYLLLKNRLEFSLISIRVNDGRHSFTPLKNPFPFNATEFSVTDDGVLVGGNYNQRPLVIYYNFGQGKSKILPGFFNEVGELNQLKTYADGSIEAIVSASNFNKRKSLWIRTFDTEGNLTNTTLLEPEAKMNLISGKSFPEQDGRKVVLGSYGRYSDYARGIFSAEINREGKPTIVYHNFSELKKFFSYMSPRHEKRVMERIERRQVKGKKIRNNFRYLVHEVIPYRDEYILLGEVYSIQYRYVGGSTGFFGTPTRSQMIFDGYKYSHAVIAGFNHQGKLLWDNTFKIENVKTMSLEQFVKIEPMDDNKMDMLYVYANSLRSKTIRETDVIEGKSTNPLYGSNPRNIEAEQTRLDYWYDGHLYASGALWIKGPLMADGNSISRRVFFISKIVCQ